MTLETGETDPRLRGLQWGELPPILASVTEALTQVLSGDPAERVLDKLLRRHREWTSDQRALAAESLFGVGLWRRRLAFHLSGAPGDWAALPARELLAAFLVIRAGCPLEHARTWTHARCELQTNSTAPDLGCRFSLPPWLADLLEAELGPDAAAFASALNHPGPIFLRTNTLKTSRPALTARLDVEGVETLPTPHAPDGLVVRSKRPNLWSLPSYRDGAFEVQDEGSQLLGALLETRPGLSTLDYCAGAGGKTLQLAAAMEDAGPLHVYDPDATRLERLRQRASRAGVRRLLVHQSRPPETLQVDRVLVDAPCSELGALRRGPDLRFRIAPQSLDTWPQVQRTILANAARHVAPDGLLLYATCTIRRAENEDIARAFEQDHPNFQRLRPGAGWLPDTFIRDGFFVALPHLHSTDGFFGALWKRC